MIPLPPEFLTRPIAHRALHDRAAGRPENSAEAIQAAIDAGFGIEIDLQLSRDQVAMTFHDYDLGRLTGSNGAVAQQTAGALGKTILTGGDSGIPTFRETLEQVAGQVPLLVELKDQDGALGPNIGALEAAVAADLAGYAGPVALMSFNPHAIVEMARLCPDIPRGLVTTTYPAADWPTVPAARRAELAEIPDFDTAGCSFISHEAALLDHPPVHALKARGMAVLCWTIRSTEEEAQARKIADNITFESYLPG